MKMGVIAPTFLVEKKKTVNELNLLLRRHIKFY